MDKSKEAIKQLRNLKKLIPDKHQRLAAEWKEDWQILISTILSAQTKDETTITVSEILYKRFKKPDQLGKAKLSVIEKIIRPINYYKTKSKNIKETSKIISKKGIPKTTEELIELPGVGRKVANIYLSEAHKMQKIGVDTHVARISQKLNWTTNKNPHKIEKDLEKLFPKRYWRSINEILVKFGRQTKKNQEDKILEKL